MAEFYRSLDDANSYFDDQLFATDWTGSTDANKLRALTQAARAIDSLKFKGEKLSIFTVLDADSNASASEVEAADAAQPKAWPRDSGSMAVDAPTTVHTINAWTTSPTAGNFTLSITLSDGTSFTTAGIAFDANAATIETAIDTAATGVVTGFTAGDIAATGGGLDLADVVLTFSGNSVSEESHNDRPTVTPDATFLVDGVVASPATAVTISGEVPDRIFWAQCEEAISLLSGRDPKQEWENAVLTSDGVSSTRVSADRSQTPPSHTAHMFTSALAWKYLVRYIDKSENTSFRVHRTGGIPNLEDN